MLSLLKNSPQMTILMEELCQLIQENNKSESSRQHLSPVLKF